VAPSPEETGKPGEAWASPSPKSASAVAGDLNKLDDGLKVTPVESENPGSSASPPALKAALESAPEAIPEATPEATPENVMDAPREQEEESKEEAKASKASGADDDDDDAPFIERPEGLANQIVWAVSLPVYVPLWFLTPQPSAGRACGGALPVPVFICTFAVSLLWISLFAFLLVSRATNVPTLATLGPLRPGRQGRPRGRPCYSRSALRLRFLLTVLAGHPRQPAP